MYSSQAEVNGYLKKGMYAPIHQPGAATFTCARPPLLVKDPTEEGYYSNDQRRGQVYARAFRVVLVPFRDPRIFLLLLIG